VSAFSAVTGCTLQGKTAKPLSDSLVLLSLAQTNTTSEQVCNLHVLRNNRRIKQRFFFATRFKEHFALSVKD